MMIIVWYHTYDGSENNKYHHIHCGENEEVQIVYDPVRAIPKSMHFHHCSEFVLLLVYKVSHHNLNYSLRVSILPSCIIPLHQIGILCEYYIACNPQKKRTPITSYRKKQDNNPLEKERTENRRKINYHTSGLLRHLFCEVQQHLYTWTLYKLEIGIWNLERCQDNMLFEGRQVHRFKWVILPSKSNNVSIRRKG